MTEKTEDAGGDAPGGEDAHAKLWREQDAEAAKAAGSAQDPDDDSQSPAHTAADEGVDQDDSARTDPDQTDDEDEAPPAKTAAGGKTTETVDWSQAPEVYRKAMEDERKRHGGRTSAMTQQLRTLQGQLAEMTAKSAARVTGEGDDDADEDEAATERSDLKGHIAKLKDVAADYPEIGAPFLEAIEAMQGDLARLTQSETSRQSSVFADNAKAVEAEHPNYTAFISENAEALWTWLEEDAPIWAVRAWEANQNSIADPSEAKRLLGAFKAHLGHDTQQRDPDPQGDGRDSPPNPDDERRRRQRAAGSAPRGSGPSMTAGVPSTGTHEDLWKSWDRVEKRAG